MVELNLHSSTYSDMFSLWGPVSGSKGGLSGVHSHRVWASVKVQGEIFQTFARARARAFPLNDDGVCLEMVFSE